jgi:hypothetical protein
VTLADLRKLAIRRQIRICFPLRNGMECVVTEHGVAQVPALKGVPDFNLEEELATAAGFVLDPVAAGKAASPKAASPSATLDREAIAAMLGSCAAAPAGEHDEE